jgi:Sec20
MSAVDVPPHLQQSFGVLASLHTSIDSCLADLSTAVTVADITARTRRIKQQIAELQQRIEKLQATLSTDPIPNSGAESPPVLSSSDSRSIASSLLSQHAAIASTYSNQLRQRILASRAGLSQRAKQVRLELLTPAASSRSDTAQDRRRQFSASLSHTQELLSSSLSLSSASLSSLENSTASLRSTQRQSAAYKDVVKGGSQVITKQMQRAKTDRLLLCCGLLFFLTVCLYITNKRLRIGRILYGLWQLLAPPALVRATEQPMQQQRIPTSAYGQL